MTFKVNDGWSCNSVRNTCVLPELKLMKTGNIGTKL